MFPYIARSCLRRQFIAVAITMLVIVTSAVIVLAARDTETYGASVGGKEWTAETSLQTGDYGTWNGYAKALSDDGNTLMLLDVSWIGKEYCYGIWLYTSFADSLSATATLIQLNDDGYNPYWAINCGAYSVADSFQQATYNGDSDSIELDPQVDHIAPP